MWRYQTPGLAARQSPLKGLSYYWHLTGNPHSMITEIMSLSNEVSILLNCIVGRRSYFFLAFYECILGLSFAPASQTYWRRVMQKQPKSLEICSEFYYQLFQAHPCLCQIWNHLKTSAVLATKKRWGGEVVA